MISIKKQSFYNILLIGFAFLFFSNCQTEKALPSPFQNIKDEKVKTLLSQVIEKAGGLENWNKIELLHFKKYFALYDSLGNIETEVDQVHDYLFPKQDINIKWKKEDTAHHLRFAKGKITKLINNQPDPTANKTSLLNTIRSATFVMSIPFNFLDPGIAFQHEGFDTLEEGQEVEVLRADFNPDEHNNHSTKDTWWFYFNKNDHNLVAYLVKHADHYSYVKNISFTEVDGFVFPLIRKSWRVNKGREILYLRADYKYSDYSIN